jgi:SepF-like predicted cell division protein (DUF552 family)
MKKILSLILIFSLSFVNSQKKSGMHSQEKFESIFENMNWENKIITGNGKISVAQDKYTKKLMTIIEAYNNKDAKTYAQFNSVDGRKDVENDLKNQFENNIETVLITPYRIEPTKVEGEDVTRVEVWSNKKISYYNGSKENYWTVDVYIFNSEDLIDGYYSHTFRPGGNEYGLNFGGKFIAEGNANNGSPFVFSNKGEVDFIEKFAEAYNSMDVEALSSLDRVSEVDINTPENEQLKLNFNDKEFWKSFFKGKESINWNIWAIIPIKIANTDPASGATVYSTHTTIFEDGQEIKEERVQLFFFDVDGNLVRVNGYNKSL